MPVDAGGTGGAVAMYMAAMPDGGPVMRYQAVMPPEAGVAEPDYMAVMPVEPPRGNTGRVVALYAAPVPIKN